MDSVSNSRYHYVNVNHLCAICDKIYRYIKCHITSILGLYRFTNKIKPGNIALSRVRVACAH